MNKNSGNIEQITEWIESGERMISAKLWSQAVDYFIKASELAEKVDLKKSHLLSLMRLAFCHEHKLIYTKAIGALNQAIEVAKRMNNRFSEALVLYALANINLKLSEYEVSLEYIYRTIRIYEDLNEHELIGKAYIQIAEINLSTLSAKVALQNLLEAKKLLKYHSDQVIRTKLYRLLAQAYLENKEENKAFYYCLKSNEKAISLQLYHESRKNYLLMGRAYMQLGQYKQAFKNYRLALQAAHKVNDDLEVAIVQNKIAELHQKCGKYNEALKVLNKVVSIAIIKSDNYLLSDIYHNYTQAYEGLGKFQKALQYFKKYNHIQLALQEYKIRLKTDAFTTKLNIERAEKQKFLAVESLRLKEQFLSNISHEIKIPMHNIIGLCSNILTDNPKEEHQKDLKSVHDSAIRLNQMLNDLLYLSKINAGKLSVYEKDFELTRYVDQLMSLVNLVKKQKPIKISHHIDPAIPKILQGDPHRLLQILLNLFNNAVKFTHEGEVGLNIKLISNIGKKLNIQFTVFDTGIGISEDNFEHIFKPFQQIENTDSHIYKGSGMGLNIVKNIVKLLNGSVSVESIEHKGSKFHVELPFTISNKDKIESFIKEEVDKTETNDTLSENAKILIVEDNKINQLYIKRILKKWEGVSFDVAADGKQAINILEKESFDLILMDLQMPGMDGFELTHYIRTKIEGPLSYVPIVAITADSSPSIEEKVMEAGMNGYLFKPFKPRELLKISELHININKIKEKKALVTKTAEDETGILHKLSKKLNGDKRYMAEFVEIFLDQYPEAVTLLLYHISEQDWEQVQRVAHRIKSTINIIGLMDLYEVIKAIDKHSRTETNKETIMPLYKQFVEIGNLRVIQLNNELQKLTLTIELENKMNEKTTKT